MPAYNARPFAGHMEVMQQPIANAGASFEEVEALLTRLYADHGRAVMAYALRRAQSPEDAADIVAETFFVALRRPGKVPPGAAARPWLYGVARRVLANQMRGERRRVRLAERLRVELSTKASSEVAPDVESVVTDCLARMPEADREVLLLAGWEGLEPTEIARVLDVSAVAVRGRLFRARRRLRDELAKAGLTTGNRPTSAPDPRRRERE
jgi:RNA polymerase sigma-70 factor, ECF subfamily